MADGGRFADLLAHVEYLADRVFSEYEPTRGPAPDFWIRCRDWLDGAPDEADQQLLFETIPYLRFVARAEFEALYRAAMHEHVIPWLVDLLDVALDDPQAEDFITAAIRQTWFCPVTDSMQIGAFYHLNGLSGADFRPDWRSLAEFGDPARIRSHMQKNAFARLVLLEDFVGAGTQMLSAVTFAATLPSQPPILVCPLVVCPEGVTEGENLAATNKHVTFSPVLQVPLSAMVMPTPQAQEPKIFAEIRSLISRLEPLIKGNVAVSSQKYFGPFGYRDTGALIVLHSNCPDNSLPVVHRRSSTWSPLFPRSTRI